MNSILLGHVCQDLVKLIIEFAFKHTMDKELFKLGYYERCSEILNNIITLGLNDIDLCRLTTCLFGEACKGGHIDIVKFMIEKGATDYNYGLRGTCEGGNVEIVNLMIKQGATDWDEGLYFACLGGHMEIVKLMIKCEATDWYSGLRGACKGGHMEIVKLMIKCEATDWYSGLIRACKGGNIEIVKRMIEKEQIIGMMDYKEHVREVI